MGDNTPANYGSSGVEFTRIKISIPKRLLEEFQALADEYYDENRSWFFRVAGKDHKHTLNSGDRTKTQKIHDEVRNNRDEIHKLVEILEALDFDSKQTSGVEITGEHSENPVEANGRDVVRDDMWPVYQRLADAYPAALSESEIVSSGSLSESDVQHALIDLRNIGKIVSTSVEGVVKYEIATDDSI